MNTDMLRLLIRSYGLTLDAAARRCGISKMTLCKILKGSDIRISTLRAIASAFNIPPCALLREGGSGEHLHPLGVSNE